MGSLTKPVFLSVVGFDELQHYKLRSPPWIKLYARLWNNPKFELLSDVNKAHYLGICILASQHNNKIPCDINWLERHISATNPLDLNILLASGLLAKSGKMLAERKQNALSERETEKEKRESREETDTEAEMYVPHGEFGYCLLRPIEFGKLQTKLGSRLPSYIDRFDRWLEENPKMRKTRKAYPSILNWADRDRDSGRNGNGNYKDKQQLNLEAAERVLARLHPEDCSSGDGESPRNVTDSLHRSLKGN